MAQQTQETQLIWEAAGRPEPCDTTGELIPVGRGDMERCARCGDPEGLFTHKQIVSTNFIPTRNANRLRTFATKKYCKACVFCSKTLRLRCVSWFATESGVLFWTTRPDQNGVRPDALDVLLNPPTPPFVVGVPLYGIAHGGEANWRRTWWPGEPMSDVPLTRLQSKHVAIYSRISFSRDLFPVQVDDQADFVLDRDVWLRARDAATIAIEACVADGIAPYPAKLSLLTLALPKKASLQLARTWSAITSPLRPLIGAQWFPLFIELLKTPEDTREKT